MTDRVGVDPAEDRLARHLQPSSSLGAILHRLGTYDSARVYVTVAQMSTPLLDEPLSRLSTFANHSKPWFLIAGVLALTRRSPGAAGRRNRSCGDSSSIADQQPADETHGEAEAPCATRTWGPRGSVGSHADLDVVPVGTLRLRGSLCGSGRRRGAITSLAASFRGRGRVFFVCLHRSALSRRRRRRGDDRSSAGVADRSSWLSTVELTGPSNFAAQLMGFAQARPTMTERRVVVAPPRAARMPYGRSC